MVSRRVQPLKPRVSMTSVSPSQRPTEWPNHCGFGSFGCSRPSVGHDVKPVAHFEQERDVSAALDDLKRVRRVDGAAQPERQTGARVVAVGRVVAFPVLLAGRREGQVGLAGLVSSGPRHVRDVGALPDAAQVGLLGCRQTGGAEGHPADTGPPERSTIYAMSRSVPPEALFGRIRAHDTPNKTENAFDIPHRSYENKGRSIPVQCRQGTHFAGEVVR